MLMFEARTQLQVRSSKLEVQNRTMTEQLHLTSTYSCASTSAWQRLRSLTLQMSFGCTVAVQLRCLSHSNSQLIHHI